jgi:CSLREA domain-containing protein
MNTRSIHTAALILVMGALAPAGASASTTLADSAGIWATRPVDAVLLSPDGAKASVDPGPARCAALGHLDSDGVIDLVVAHGSEGHGFAVVTLGDIRFRKGPHHDLEREKLGLEPERPFLDEAVVYQLPFAPDWAAVGDWDSDGDFDVVFAARGLNRLYWMAGDGQAHLTPGGLIDLAGGVTAFASGEVNRRDGLDDLVLAIDGASGPALLVFESPEGALSCGPERIGMPTPVNSLAIDWLDGDPWRDIAAASGEAVVIVSGRDRRLVSTRAKREAVPPAAITPLDFDAEVLDLAAGFFTHRDHQAQLAVRLESGRIRLVRNLEHRFEISDLGRMPVEGRMLAARASGLRGHDLLIDHRAERPIEIFHAGASKASGSHLERVRAPEVPVEGIYPGRLNLDTRDDLVMLGSDGSVEVAASKSRSSIVVNSDDDVDDGSCDGNHCSLREAINLANSLTVGSDITFDLSVLSTIEPTSALPELSQTAATTIDGTVGSGYLTSPVYLEGASAGDDVEGLRIFGGNASLTHVRIGGFAFEGIILSGGGNNTIESCSSGIEADGTAANPNSYGIAIFTSDNTIGGTAAGAGNTLSGNTQTGIELVSGTSGNTFLGNVVGLDPTGAVSIPNGIGVHSNYGWGGTIGTAVSGGGNVVSGNNYTGVQLLCSSDPGATGWLILGNTIGLDINRADAVPNGVSGIEMEDGGNTNIGSTSPGGRNVISGQTLYGIWIGSGVVSVEITGNYIGTDGSGLIGRGNGHGISMASASDITIGGEAAGAGNLISDNVTNGIKTMGSSPVSDCEILGNRIGVGVDGSNLGNGVGIFLENATQFTIGSLDGPNEIAFSSYRGITIDGASSGVEIGPNSIHDNTYPGIDLGGDGITQNDALDYDTGPNGLQNFPVIEAVDQAAGDVDFYIESGEGITYTLRFYESPSCHGWGYGEGKTYLGSTSITTEQGGSAGDQITLGPLTPGAVITATATDPDGNTSEFSQCFSVPMPDGFIFFDNFESGDTSAWSD